jgi:hypothetical protein
MGAGRGDEDAAKGIYFARRGDCARATRLLEDAERTRHRPSSALALADCKLAAGDLLGASDLYQQVAADKPVRGWVRPDYNAVKAAQQKAADVASRIPTLRLRLATAYEQLAVEVDGKRLDDLDVELRFAPKAHVKVIAHAKGRAEFEEEVVLDEGDRKVVTLKLEPLVPAAAAASNGPTGWIGARYYGAVIPRFVMRIFADGGRTLAVPGAAATFTTRIARRAEVTVALGYLSYRMPETAFKPIGEPDTEWELVGSTLGAFTATADFIWSFPFDAAEHASFRVGGAVGFGVMAIGSMTRVQSYPANGVPGDPSTYLPCIGPNNPRGTFAYCNALDKDATHYPGYTEPDWFHGGLRPMLFPWVVLPQVGFGFKPTRSFGIDLDTGVSISGFLTSLGFRFGI